MGEISDLKARNSSSDASGLHLLTNDAASYNSFSSLRCNRRVSACCECSDVSFTQRLNCA